MLYSSKNSYGSEHLKETRRINREVDSSVNSYGGESMMDLVILEQQDDSINKNLRIIIKRKRWKICYIET